MMKKLLKNLTFTLALSCIAVQGQDTSAFLHMQFENNLNASTTQASGVVFEAENAATLGYSIPYGTGTITSFITGASVDGNKEGMYALNYSAITDDTSPEVNLIQNGSGQPATIKSTTDFAILGNAARTFSAWIRYDDLNNITNGAHCILQMGDPASSTQGRINWNFRPANNDVQLAVGGGNVRYFYDTDTTLEDGNWHHVAFTYAAGAVLDNIVFYVDGAAVSNDGGSNSSTVDFDTVANTLSVGSTNDYNQKWFDGGGIDDLRIYDYALTAAEIATIYGGAYLSVEDVAFAENELKAFPNAVDDILQLQTTSNSVLQINVFDISGKVIKRTSGNSVDMSDLASGMYIVKVREDNKVANLRILKK